MKSGQAGFPRSLLVRLALGLLPWFVAGCASAPPALDRELMAAKGSKPSNHGVADQYMVSCPDVLELKVQNRPELTGRRTVGPDGRIDLGPLGGLRVEGQTVPAIARQLADRTGLRPEVVEVQVAEFNSQQVYLFGQVEGLQRAVPYHGQETVLDLLQRIGGITSGAEASEVYVVRSRVADGQTPEIYHIDLQAILKNRDHATNLRLLPFDQIHIGETRQSCLNKCLPPCVRPIYRAISGVRHNKAKE